MRLEYLDKLILGCWQLSRGHSEGLRDGLAVLKAHYAAGFRVFDCADIYTGVEALLGEFIRTHGLSAEDIKVHTKYVPDLSSLASLDRGQVERTIDRSRARLGLERLDLVQFHWWDYGVPGWLEALDTLSELRNEGKIKEIGLTNFDAERVEEVLERGHPIAAIQTQFSVLDRRPRKRLAALAKNHGVALLCYGSLAGGLLSDRYLGKKELHGPFENRSLVKYMLVLEEVGGWKALQAILMVLRDVADERQTDVASVACAYVLSQEAVRACIVGIRSARHLEHLRALRDTVRLSESDLGRIEAVRSAFPEVPGGVYELERDREGKHGRIMRYDLNS